MAMEEWKVGVGGGGGVGLGAGGGGMGLGEGGWSIAGRRGGMLFCWFSLTVKKSFILLFLVCLKPFPFRDLTFSSSLFSLRDGGGGGPLRGRALV
jgi:hypothetical protein